MKDLRLHAPVAPRQVFCTIGNYSGQLIEAAEDSGDGPAGAGAGARREAALGAIQERRRSGAPYICLKPSSTVRDPTGALVINAEHTMLDWEVELGVIIGDAGGELTIEQAASAIAGYCVVNDITLRSAVFREEPPRFGTDWLQSKGGRGWLPAGPWFVPSWNVSDASALRLWLRLNGTLMQDGCTDDMVFGIAEQIAYLSRHVALLPGDLICTGSPAGFGSHLGRFLRPGDVVEAGIDGLGTQRISFIEGSPSSHPRY
ncbi:fumarylacetoacetate hydrolase family protein [Variovorax sp. J31P207]|uniref:fumarylacetoacetate hydrolase family protein n=1 Tax=Variovorax sp. J31P207 TaxID=3053510 RepID=UPI0025789CC1|nr:fumarylacetoacetate hydrolase family protein [Variovorax sp. J31P207]MDM0072346.1 fumarylacetoacetate hydrolase family protein [Variovorax sp. J31P207]